MALKACQPSQIRLRQGCLRRSSGWPPFCPGTPGPVYPREMRLIYVFCFLVGTFGAAAGRQLREAETYAFTADQQADESLEVSVPFEFLLPGAPPQLLNATFAITLPPQNASLPAKQLPLLFLLHGFNVPPQYYSRLVADLASKGYAVVVPDIIQPVAYSIPGLPRPGCPSAYHLSYPGLLNAFYDNLEDLPVPFDELGIDPQSIVLLGHSQGGAGAIYALTGQCSGAVNALTAYGCGGYRPLNATILGIITYEGVPPGPPISLPPNTFAIYLGGSFSNTTSSAGQTTTGTACTGWLQFDDMNHYGIADYQDGVAGQVTPCARPASADPPSWTTTYEEKVSGIDLIADIVDATVSGDVSGKWGGLLSFVGNPRVLDGDFSDRCVG